MPPGERSSAAADARQLDHHSQVGRPLPGLHVPRQRAAGERLHVAAGLQVHECGMVCGSRDVTQRVAAVAATLHSAPYDIAAPQPRTTPAPPGCDAIPCHAGDGREVYGVDEQRLRCSRERGAPIPVPYRSHVSAALREVAVSFRSAARHVFKRGLRQSFHRTAPHRTAPHRTAP